MSSSPHRPWHQPYVGHCIESMPASSIPSSNHQSSSMSTSVSTGSSSHIFESSFKSAHEVIDGDHSRATGGGRSMSASISISPSCHQARRHLPISATSIFIAKRRLSAIGSSSSSSQVRRHLRRSHRIRVSPYISSILSSHRCGLSSASFMKLRISASVKSVLRAIIVLL
jgi:hypothetical protein